jgi:DNA anti-recombination protein RmuC
MIELFKDYIGEAILLVLGVITTYLSGRQAKNTAVKESAAALKHKDAEIASLKINNSNQIMEQYQKALTDLEQRYESKHNYLQSDYNRRLEDIKEDYERRIKFINETNDHRYTSLSRKYDKLKSDFNTYKEKHP